MLSTAERIKKTGPISFCSEIDPSDLYLIYEIFVQMQNIRKHTKFKLDTYVIIFKDKLLLSMLLFLIYII